MTTSTYQKENETYFEATKTERERIRNLIKIAITELENDPEMSPEEVIKNFEDLRQEIINQCKLNETI